MRFSVTQKMIDEFASNGNYWYTRIGRSMGTFSSGSADPIAEAVYKKSGRRAKVDYWPSTRIGVLTKCQGGYYMFDLPQELRDASVVDNGVLVVLRPVEFDLPLEEHLEREIATEARMERERFAYSI